MNEEQHKAIREILAWNEAHPHEIRIPIYMTMRAVIFKKAQALADRRYPGDSIGRDKVITDAVIWKQDGWHEHGMTLGDWFWWHMANSGILSLAAFAWGKLIAPYFDEVVDNHA